MKTSITKALVITLAATVKVAKACADYSQCRCTMADGSINATITTQACALYHKAAGLDGTSGFGLTPALDDDNVVWCVDGDVDDGKRHTYVDNCKMREFCTQAGATGNDSLCRVKVPQP
ncbi:hypothetical protein LX32DRAFT_646310 [Colletotrichum zoysiae]|uniref:Cyanovirin-N domain-containing protein n=1 Tax=Colletotrichum zoysiae TaxID=1216348 RepID=A0AAD9LXA0_9PEZI|nr:hypothetical protein LX32DRAFT_646310 [Colletotrichum zoysiae]